MKTIIEWKPIKSAPRDGTLILIAEELQPNLYTAYAAFYDKRGLRGDPKFPWIFFQYDQCHDDLINGMPDDRYGPVVWAEMPACYSVGEL